MNFCKDCKYAVPISDRFIDKLFGLAYKPELFRCSKSPKKLDKVTGKSGGYFFCSTVRDFEFKADDCPEYQPKENK